MTFHVVLGRDPVSKTTFWENCLWCCSVIFIVSPVFIASLNITLVKWTRKIFKSLYIWDALRDWVSFALFKKREKQSWRNVTLVKLQGKAYNFDKSSTTPWIFFFTLFKLWKWYQIPQSVTCRRRQWELSFCQLSEIPDPTVTNIDKKWSFPINNFFSKCEFSIKNFFSICDQTRRKLRIWSHQGYVTYTEQFLNGKPQLLCSEINLKKYDFDQCES